MTAASGNDYDIAMQVFGMFLVTSVSYMGMCLTFAFKSMGPGGSCRAAAMLLLKGFGVGTIVSTACIHLINEAFSNFEDAGWSVSYDAWPFVFALSGFLLFAMVEFYSHRGSHTSDSTTCILELESLVLTKVDDREGHSSFGTFVPGSDSKNPNNAGPHQTSGHNSSSIAQKTVAVVELSILCHSVVIGFDLGLQPRRSWKTLVIAVCFHQFFEGVALAQVILEAEMPKARIASMTLFYSLTTSLGIAIGILTHTTSGDGKSFQLVIGILNSFCGGVILYIGLISLFVPWFVHNQALARASKSLSLLGFSGIALGFFAMAIIGIWT